MSFGAVTPLPPDIAAAYLAQDPADNVELLVSLRHDEEVSCLGVIAGDRVTGVLVAGKQWYAGPSTAMIATTEPEVVVMLGRALPPGTMQLAVHRPWMLPVLDPVMYLTPVPYGELLVLTTRTPVAPPMPHGEPIPGVRPLTAADAAIVAASATPWGHEGFMDALRHGYRPFGVVRAGRVVARAMAAYATHETEEVSAVWTAPAWRSKGLATAVAATVAADIRTRVPLAIYTVRPDNFASRRVAEKVGFTLAHSTVTYRVSKRL